MELTKLLWKFLYSSFGALLYLFWLGIYLFLELLDHGTGICLTTDNCHFLNKSINLHSQQQCFRVSIAPDPYQQSYHFFFYFSHSIWCVTKNWNFSLRFLTRNEVEYLCVGLLDTLGSACLNLCRYWIFFLFIICRSYLYTLDISPIYFYIVNILPHS